MVMLVSELRPDSCVVAEVRASPNHSERKNGMMPDMIVLHYTGTRDTEAAIGQLCNPKSEVSAHYVVLQDGCILQLVPESRRAWHAGVSSWAGENDVNSRSIGIEIANPGHEHGYPDFPRRQIAAVTALCRSILTRHDVPADRMLARLAGGTSPAHVASCYAGLIDALKPHGCSALSEPKVTTTPPVSGRSRLRVMFSNVERLPVRSSSTTSVPSFKPSSRKS